MMRKLVAWVGLLALGTMAGPNLAGAQSRAEIIRGLAFPSAVEKSSVSNDDDDVGVQKSTRRTIIGEGALTSSSTHVAYPSRSTVSTSAAGDRHESASRSRGQAASGGAMSFANITFETDSAELSASCTEILSNIGGALASPELTPYRFRIAGHTDARGSDERNERLSQDRAAAVVQYLVDNFGLDRGRFEVVGYGASHLKDSENPAGRANRRVEVVNLGPKS